MHIIHYNINDDDSLVGPRRNEHYIRKLTWCIVFDGNKKSKHIMFRGRIRFVPKPIKSLYSDIFVTTKMYKNSKFEMINLMRNDFPLRCRYGLVTQCYDPRMFGSCDYDGEPYICHEVRYKTDDVCACCKKPFPGLIPPIICGRLIWHLPSI